MSTMEELTTSEWTGVRGRIGGWYLNSPLRTLSEMLLLGNCRGAFLRLATDISPRDGVVLDVGAGSGYFSLALAKSIGARKVICLDLSKEMLQRLQQRAEREGLRERVQIVRAEAVSSGVESDSVDLAVSNGVFHELSDPELVLREMLRVLKPGGWVVVTDFRDTRIGRRIGAAHREGSHGPFGVEGLAALLSQAGLENVRATPVRHWVIGAGRKCYTAT